MSVPELPSSPLQSHDAELVARNSAQPALFADFSDAGEVLENRKEYTGQQLLARKPELYRAIVGALGEGLGVRQIARALRVSHHTVMAVRRNEPGLVATHKKETAQQLRTVASLATERLIDEIDKVKLEALPVVIGVAIEKAQLLDGEATARVETVKGPTHDDYLRLVAEAEAAAKAGAIEVETIPVTGFEEKIPGQKGALDLGGSAALPSPTGDSRSSVFHLRTTEREGVTKDATTHATDEKAKEDTADPDSAGGGGGQTSEPGGG